MRIALANTEGRLKMAEGALQGIKQRRGEEFMQVFHEVMHQLSIARRSAEMRPNVQPVDPGYATLLLALATLVRP